MKNYIRFGEIPIYERSINYFTYLYEDGVSVFNIDTNGEIEINNMRLISSLLNRLHEKAYLVKGIEIGNGNDNEPLLRDVKIIEEITIDRIKIFEQVHNILEKNSLNKEGLRKLYYDYEKQNNNHLCSFHIEPIKCTHCGKITNRYELCNHNKKYSYEQLPDYIEYYFDGVTYWNFKDSFDTVLGLNKDKYSNSKQRICIKCNTWDITKDSFYWDMESDLYICNKCGFKTKYPITD